MVKQYIINILISIDQFFNTLFGGDPDETISSAAGKYAERGSGWIPCQLCKFLNLLDKGHCKRAIELDEGRRSIL